MCHFCCFLFRIPPRDAADAIHALEFISVLIAIVLLFVLWFSGVWVVGVSICSRAYCRSCSGVVSLGLVIGISTSVEIP